MHAVAFYVQLRLQVRRGQGRDARLQEELPRQEPREGGLPAVRVRDEQGERILPGMRETRKTAITRKEVTK